MDNIYFQILWEKHYWPVMQSYVHNYPQLPNKSTKKNMYNTFIHSGFLIPHQNFKKLYFLYLENISIVNFLDNKTNLMNYLHNLYTFIFNKTKQHVIEIKKLKDINEDDIVLSHFDSEPKKFDEFWSDYIKIYNPPPPKLSYHKLLYIQSVLYIIIITMLIIFIFYIYKYEIRNFVSTIFRNFSL